MGKTVAAGTRSVGIYKPEPMFGVSTEILENHGLSSLAAETVLTWKKISTRLDDAQRKAIVASGSETIYRAGKTATGYELVPLRMLGRSGIDIGWKNGSEFGPIVPRQYIRTGDGLKVENPFAGQEPEFVIRVMSGFNGQTEARIGTDSKAADGIPKDKAIVDSYNTGTGLKPADPVAAKADSNRRQNARIQPKLEKLRNAGDHQFAAEGEALRLRFENKRNETIVNQESLPFWDCSVNMMQARGIGLTVTGDGSGAVLVLQAHCSGPRDYIVPLDFKGEREFIIPCGEVSWTDARWGWRFDTKDSHYGTLRRVSLGLGKVPSKTAVDIKIANLRILPEIPSALKNPVIALGDGSLQIIGVVQSDSYLWYQGGDKIGVHDLNWKKIAELPVKKQNFIAPKGPLQIRIDSPESAPAPWLECQFFVKDAPMVVK